LIGFAICTIVIGLALYLIFPLAFLNEDLGLQGTLLLWLLAGIISGISLFLNNFQSAFEVFVQKIFFFWEKLYVRRLMMKNTLIHSKSNRKTGLVYSISLAILNFVYISYYLEIESMSMQSYYDMGGELVLRHPSLFYFQKYNNMSPLREKVKYTWLMEPIAGSKSTSFEPDLPGFHSSDPPPYSIQHLSFYITDMSKQTTKDISPVLSSPNYTRDLKMKSDFTPYKSFGDPLEDMVENLYMKHNFRSIIISRSLYYNFNGHLWDEKKSNYLYIKILDPQKKEHYYKVRIAGVVDYLPGVHFGVLPFSNHKDVLISPDIFHEFAYITKMGIEDYEMKKLSLEINDQPVSFRGKTIIDNIGSEYSMDNKADEPIELESPEIKTTYEDMLNDLLSHSSFHKNQIYVLNADAKEFKNTEKLLNIFFNLTTCLVLIICFFNLTASMSSKIISNSKQLAILRSLGFSKLRTALLYLYDSFLVVFSASFIGLLAGALLAWLFILQRTLFLDLPMKVHFSWGNLIFILIASFISAFLSAFIPIMLFLKKPLSQITK
jgi:hypothetical protein